jgi:hypothetical protein
MDYGVDFGLTDDDVVFTSDGDIELVSGPACAAQDIDQTLKTTLDGATGVFLSFWGLMLGAARKQDNKTAGPV